MNKGWENIFHWILYVIAPWASSTATVDGRKLRRHYLHVKWLPLKRRLKTVHIFQKERYTLACSEAGLGRGTPPWETLIDCWLIFSVDLRRGLVSMGKVKSSMGINTCILYQKNYLKMYVFPCYNRFGKNQNLNTGERNSAKNTFCTETSTNQRTKPGRNLTVSTLPNF